MKSIVIIIPYFGKLHNYFPIWLQSVKNNPTINFILFTDDETSYHYPDNISVNYCSFNDIVKMCQRVFDFEINLTTPYKLCDYRPFYGLIFSEYIKNYDYWGFCDIDLIFGNIRNFINNDILENNNRILSHGHLSIFKNSLKNNNLCKSIVDGCMNYKDVLTSSKNYYFDECFRKGTSTDIYIKLDGDHFYQKKPFDDVLIPSSANNFVDFNLPEKSYFLLFKYKEGKIYRVFILNGKQHCEESLYVHLQKRKMKIKTSDFNKFIIIPNKFIPYKDNINLCSQIFYGRSKYIRRFFKDLAYSFLGKEIRI